MLYDSKINCCRIMKVFTRFIKVRASKKNEFVDLTRPLKEFVREVKIDEGTARSIHFMLQPDSQSKRKKAN